MTNLFRARMLFVALIATVLLACGGDDSDGPTDPHDGDPSGDILLSVDPSAWTVRAYADTAGACNYTGHEESTEVGRFVRNGVMVVRSGRTVSCQRPTETLCNVSRRRVVFSSSARIDFRPYTAARLRCRMERFHRYHGGVTALQITIQSNVP